MPLTGPQAERFHGCRRIVRHVDTGALIGVALEVCVAVGRADRLWLHGDSREVYRFLAKSGKVVGMPWRADPATDEEVAEALAELGQ